MVRGAQRAVVSFAGATGRQSSWLWCRCSISGPGTCSGSDHLGLPLGRPAAEVVAGAAGVGLCFRSSDHGLVTELRMATSFFGRGVAWASAFYFDGVLVDAGPPRTAQALAEWLRSGRFTSCSTPMPTKTTSAGIYLLSAEASCFPPRAGSLGASSSHPALSPTRLGPGKAVAAQPLGPVVEATAYAGCPANARSQRRPCYLRGAGARLGLHRRPVYLRSDSLCPGRRKCAGDHGLDATSAGGGLPRNLLRPCGPGARWQERLAPEDPVPGRHARPGTPP